MQYELQAASNRSQVVEAKSFKDAIRKAWGKRPPKDLGVIIRFRGTGREGEWRYLDSRIATRIAGHKTVKS